MWLLGNCFVSTGVVVLFALFAYLENGTLQRKPSATNCALNGGGGGDKNLGDVESSFWRAHNGKMSFLSCFRSSKAARSLLNMPTIGNLSMKTEVSLSVKALTCWEITCVNADHSQTIWSASDRSRIRPPSTPWIVAGESCRQMSGPWPSFHAVPTHTSRQGDLQGRFHGHHESSKIAGCTSWVANNAFHEMLDAAAPSLGSLYHVRRG